MLDFTIIREIEYRSNNVTPQASEETQDKLKQDRMKRIENKLAGASASDLNIVTPIHANK